MDDDAGRLRPLDASRTSRPELWAALDAEAKRTGVSTAELVRQGAELQLAFLAALRAAEEAQDVGGLLAAMLRRVGQ